MKDNKYYTPTIEEFHVGFEYEKFIERYKVLEEPKQKGDEWSYTVKKVEELWEPRVYKQDDFLWVSSYDGGDYEFNEIDSKETKVKHLDKEDIESLGWQNDITNSYFKEVKFLGIHKNYLQLGFKSNKKHLTYYIELLETNHVIISIYNSETMKMDIRPTILFNGTIKNISELKILLKQLNIQ